MTTSADRSPLEEQIAQWRLYLSRRRAIHGPDVEELEGHLRDQMAVLTKAGLAEEEAFLIAVKRIGSLDALSREFAREHSDRLWKQLVIAPEAAGEPGRGTRAEILVVLSLAVAAALAVKVPAFCGLQLLDGDEPFYPATPEVRAAAARGLLRLKAAGSPSDLRLAGAALRSAAIFANVFHFEDGQRYRGANRSASADRPVAGHRHCLRRRPLFAAGGRMNFVRFSGELLSTTCSSRSAGRFRRLHDDDVQRHRH